MPKPKRRFPRDPLDELVSKREVINLVNNFAHDLIATLDHRYTRLETTDERQGLPTPPPPSE